jgi:hypothetical protein
VPGMPLQALERDLEQFGWEHCGSAHLELSFTTIVLECDGDAESTLRVIPVCSTLTSGGCGG